MSHYSKYNHMLQMRQESVNKRGYSSISHVSGALLLAKWFFLH